MREIVLRGEVEIGDRSGTFCAGCKFQANSRPLPQGWIMRITETTWSDSSTYMPRRCEDVVVYASET
jgi:hypothetical protein